MASYPTAVATFTNKVDGAGNKIFAAHVNALQDEIHAIEDGLLNGTAPLVSSATRMASLDVSGNSTLHGTLTVGGTANVTGALQVTGDVTFQSTNNLQVLNVTVASPSARVFNSTQTGVNSNSSAVLNFTQEVFQVGTVTMHSTGVNPSRLVMPSSGLYWISAQVEFQPSTAGNYRTLYLRIDGTSNIAQTMVPSNADPTGNQLQVATLYRSVAGSNYAEVVVNHDAGVGLAIQASADYSPHFMMTKLR